MEVRRYGSKAGGFVAGLLLIISIILFAILWLSGKKIHTNEINKIIASKNGEVISIKEVKLEDSPFVDTMESRVGMRKGYDNTFYKIEYSTQGAKHIAWYRGVNGPFVLNRKNTDLNGNELKELPENKGKITNYDQRWIFEEDSQ
ncbi:hypothetical protein ACP26L_07795 [Paenibacillus sp. S-38]|uniref:hypothetical protein n=1 Tax=Paenibacillus sp. S-38 TaxID=3416710 RepID=UPI003CF011FC